MAREKPSLENMEIKAAYWKGKRVLITGYEGFLGSNLAKCLLSRGANIAGIDINVKRKDTILTGDDYRNISVIKGSVTNYRLVKDSILRHRPEVIFHLAAESIVGHAFSNPSRALSTNVTGTWTVLEACRVSSCVNAVVVASSDKAYGVHVKLPYKESFCLKADNPYDVSKSCSDLITRMYFHTYGLKAAITRCGNIYGPGDFNFSRIVPDAICCAISGKPLLIRSDGRFIRDYVYVEDITRGYMLLAQALQKGRFSGEAFNLSIESPITVIDLVSRIYSLLGKEPNYRIMNAARHEIRRQYLSSAKARRQLGWCPRYSLDKGLKKTIDWYKKTV